MKIQRRPSELKTTQHSFCSPACRAAFTRNGKTVQCDWCGAEFYKPLSRLRDSNFCSAVCRNRWLGKTNIEVRNVAGHSAGHSAPHLTALNQRRNTLAKRQKPEAGATASRTYRRIAEAVIGRPLKPGEVVHHINGNRADNHPENLAVLSSREHRRLHIHLCCAEDDRLEGGGAVCQKRKPSRGA